MYQSINPATATLIERFPLATEAEIDAAIGRSELAYRSWRQTSLAERSRVLREAAAIFAARLDELALIITEEMGKRIDESRGELQLVIDIFSYYADRGPDFLAEDPIDIDGGRAYIRKEPIGPILGIMPWNYPYYQVARLAAPNLLLGNTILLKHASNCGRAAAAIEQVMHDAGLPVDAYINLYAGSQQLGSVLADDRVCGVSLTGSERAGAAVAELAGKHLKKVVLELGGSDPFIVLDTDDLAGVVRVAAASRMGNTGQACNAPKRMIVMADLYDEFVTQLTGLLKQYQPGDPALLETTLAPLSSQVAVDEFEAQIADAVDKGATLHTGGDEIRHAGAYVAPTLLTDVVPGMHAYDDEIFGPAVVVLRATSEEEVVRIANDTKFGLGASVFSTDLDRATRVAEQLETGMVYINSPSGSQADLPFGGTKKSGIGRELGALGIEEFMNKKVIRIAG